MFCQDGIFLQNQASKVLKKLLSSAASPTRLKRVYRIQYFVRTLNIADMDIHSWGAHGTYDVAEKIYHEFIQGYFDAKDCGVFEAATTAASSSSMDKHIRTFAASLS